MAFTPIIAPGHSDPGLTDEQRANLRTLADYLRQLPPEYPDFAMDLFTRDGRGWSHDEAHVIVCGTAACAAGHGPSAGVEPLPGEGWNEYSERAFAGGGAWNWCFDGYWAKVDNTAHGAAARIEVLLTLGLPDDDYAQRNGYAPLSYAVPA